jgi:hypothetical protein
VLFLNEIVFIAAASLIVKFNLPILIRVIVEEIVCLTERPELGINFAGLKFETPLICFDFFCLNILSDCKILLYLLSLFHLHFFIQCNQVFNLLNLDFILLLKSFITKHFFHCHILLKVSNVQVHYVVLNLQQFSPDALGAALNFRLNTSDIDSFLE